jgi:mannose-6-phosphate isomerase-like protein (cupin superfamily)
MKRRADEQSFLLSEKPVNPRLSSGTRTGKLINRRRTCSIERFMSAQPKIENFFELVKTARMDPAVGIRIVHVTGDGHVGLFVAELGPLRSVAAHYHRTGIEIYQIVHGDGKLHTGIPSPDDVVVWNRPIEVRSGDCFTVQERQVHQLENTVSSSMIAIIVCPPAHIGQDRFIVPGAVPL